MRKSLFLYLTVVLVFVAGLYVALDQGRKLHAPQLATIEKQAPNSATEPSPSLLDNLKQNTQDPLTRLFLQLIVIVVAARICGAAARYAGQPAVIGEMLAGILLGPSLFGWLWPDVFNFIFPPASLGTLRMLSQIG